MFSLFIFDIVYYSTFFISMEYVFEIFTYKNYTKPLSVSKKAQIAFLLLTCVILYDIIKS